jgi:hypothetical protein
MRKTYLNTKYIYLVGKTPIESYDKIDRIESIDVYGKTYSFYVGKFRDLMNLKILYKGTCVETLRNIFATNGPSNDNRVSKLRNRKADVVSGLYNDTILRDGLASYGLLIDLKNKEIKVVKP